MPTSRRRSSVSESSGRLIPAARRYQGRGPTKAATNRLFENGGQPADLPRVECPVCRFKVKQWGDGTIASHRVGRKNRLAREAWPCPGSDQVGDPVKQREAAERRDAEARERRAQWWEAQFARAEAEQRLALSRAAEPPATPDGYRCGIPTHPHPGVPHIAELTSTSIVQWAIVGEPPCRPAVLEPDAAPVQQ